MTAQEKPAPDTTPLTLLGKHTHPDGRRDAPVMGVGFGPDNSTGVSVGWKHCAIVWGFETGKEVRRFAEVGPWSGDVSPDGRQLLTPHPSTSTGFGPARCWDVASGKELRGYGRAADRFDDAAFGPDGKTVLVQDGNGPPYRRVLKLFDRATGKEIREFALPVPRPGGETDYLFYTPPAFSPDGKWLLTGCINANDAKRLDGRLILWDVATGKEVRRFGSATPLYATFTPDGKAVLSLHLRRVEGDVHQDAHFWNPETGGELRAVRNVPFLLATGCQRHYLAFSPDGRFALLPDAARGVMLWEIESGTVAHRFDTHPIPRRTADVVAFSKDGKRILVGNGFGEVYAGSVPERLKIGAAKDGTSAPK